MKKILKKLQTLLKNKTHSIYGVYALAAVFALQGLFFYANWWSAGLYLSFRAILFLGLFSSPFLGIIWLYFTSWLLFLTGKWFRGKAQFADLCKALAWSKIPMGLSLLVWVYLICKDPQFVFIQDAGEASSVWINLMTLSLTGWSFILLLQSLRKLQHFSLFLAFLNILLVWFLSNSIYFSIYLLFSFLL